MPGKKTSKKKGAPGKKKPAAKKKKTTAKTGKKTGGAKFAPSFFKHVFSRFFLFVVFVLVSFGAGAGYYFIKHPAGHPAGPSVETDTHTGQYPEKSPAEEAAKPEFEVFPDEVVVKPEPAEPVIPPEPDRRPRVAIIIDDLGYDRKIAEKFLSLNGSFTYSILPHSPYGAEIANAASLNGSEVMLHLPMEPDEYPETDPGPGALFSSMTPDERISVLKKNLDAVPFISGVNNHMGSRITANSKHMNQVLSTLKTRGLYYIDSLTTPDSRSESSARLFQVPFARRDVFIDHDPKPAAIRSSLETLMRIAEINGQAIGIAHPYEATFEVLFEMLPELNGRVQLIPASEAVRYASY